MTETTKSKSSSLGLVSMNGSNPFSLEVIRARKVERFPEIGLERLNARDTRIYEKARSETLAIGFSRIKGEFAIRETAALESIAHERFFTTSTAIQQQQQRHFQAQGEDEQFQALGRIFAVEGVKRMGGAIAGMVDAVECQMLDIVDQPYELDQQQMSLVARLFSGRR